MEPDQLQMLRELCAKNTERRRPGRWRLVRRLGVLIGVLRHPGTQRQAEARLLIKSYALE